MDQFTCPTCRDMYDLGIRLIDWASGKRVDWDFICYFCGAQMPNPHRPDCLHVLAVEYLEKHEVEECTQSHGKISRTESVNGLVENDEVLTMEIP